MRHFPPPIVDRRIRFALVGCGRIAANHFAAIKKHADRAELTDVCDTDPKALARAAEQTGARPHAQLADLLRLSQADIIVLSTPSGLHPEQTIETAQSGGYIVEELKRRPAAAKS